MEDKQKVYIKGIPKRGEDIINFLKNLGGRNTQVLTGEKEDAYYFINPEGVIDFAYTFGSAIWPFIKEFYKEVKLPRWKPRLVDHYYYITTRGEVMEEVWYNIDTDNSRYEFGNCFKTFEEAEAARYKIKEMLTKE